MQLKHFVRRTFVPILNIIGMSISLMVFLVLFAQVWFDYRFNRNFEDYENIYRLEMPVTMFDAMDYKYDQMTLRPLIEEFERCSPDIVAACDYEDLETEFREKIVVNDNGTTRKYNIPFAHSDSSLPDVFTLELIAGRAEDYRNENDILLSEGYARMIFGDENPIGKIITFEMLGTQLKVVGVYKDLLENCSIINGMLICIGEADLTIPNHDPHVGFFRLKKDASVEKVTEDFRKEYANFIRSSGREIQDYEAEEIAGMRLTPIAQTHILEDVMPGIKPSANMTQMLILLSISLLFLLIAIFNFINFSMASIPFRINSINIEKVYGASRRRLIFNQLKKNIILCAASFVLATGMMEVIADSEFASFSCCSLHVGDNVPSITICFIVALATAAVGGLMTALYSTSYAPGMVLKGSFAISGKGIIFRRISIIAQFVLSCIFLICGLIISRQTNYMMQKDSGFIAENVVRGNVNLWYRWHECFDEFMKNPQVIDVTCGDMPMDEGLSSRSQLMSKDNEPVWYSIRNAYHNYFDFFGFKLADGRFPNEGEFGVAVINETFAATFPDFHIGQKLWSMSRRQYEIIGVVEDFSARPLMHKCEPMVYFIDNQNCSNIYFKMNSSNTAETIGWAEKVLKEKVSSRGADPDGISMTVTNLENDIDNMYSKEVGQSRLITSSSLLCLLIALIGVLGIVYFETQVMKKEIAIRKVNGATTGEIIRSLSWKYILTSTIGFLIAVPLSLIILNWWLSGFAYRTNISIWIFILAYLIISALTALTVIIRSYSAASENPVDALKME